MGKVEILIVEDDINLGALLKDNIELSNYNCDLLTDGNAGIEAFAKKRYDLCILDVMLPKKDGFELAREIRGQNAEVPIIFLTAKSAEEDRITGFRSGADDYVTKPFNYTELALRIDAILKRTKLNEKLSDENEIFKVGIFTFNYTLRTLVCEKETRNMTFKEAEILKIFFSQPNVLINRNVLMNKVWNSDDYVISKSLDVYLTKVRKLIRADLNMEIQNLYGTGYMLVVKPTSN